MHLYHYYDKTVGPFKNPTDVPPREAKAILEVIRQHRLGTQAAKRQQSYIEDRLCFEAILRDTFAQKGGIIKRSIPYYMAVEHSPWLSTWFENCALIKIPIQEFDLRTVSFTYGDSHPTFSPRITDDKEYRKKFCCAPMRKRAQRPHFC